MTDPVCLAEGTWAPLRRDGVAVVAGVGCPVAAVADLVLLKLYAAGPQDAWDIAQLLQVGDRARLVTEVEGVLPVLPEDSRRLWARVVESR